MHTSAFTALFSALALSLSLAPMLASAGMTAFTGQSCTGGRSGDFACDGTCQNFRGDQSFRVDQGTGPHCITAYVEGGCTTGSEMFTITGQNGECTNVVTGTNVFSVRCAPDNNCES